jgi:predicted RNA-binding protein
MKNWLYPVTEENWNVVKTKNKWGVAQEKRTKRVLQGDKIIFYVKGSGLFQGIYNVVSDWYKADDLIWEDELREGTIIYHYRLDLEPEIIGAAVLNELIPKLDFIKNKSMPSIYLQGHTLGPANHSQPISDSDVQKIKNHMSEKLIKQIEVEHGSEHGEIIAKLEEIGSTLGFTPYSDQEHTYVAKSSVVDLVWETKIANVGIIKYVFEVQSRGSKKSLITNLIQAINSPTVKKVIAVSDKKQLIQIKEQVNQMKALSDSAKAMFLFLDTESINCVYETLPTLNNFRDLLQLT